METQVGTKRYHIETAALVGEWDNGEPEDSIFYVHQALFKKPNGEFFLKFTDFSRAYALNGARKNPITTCERIQPLTFREASEWAKRYASLRDYGRFFAPFERHEPRIMLGAQVNPKTKEFLAREAARTGNAKGMMFDMIVEEYRLNHLKDL